MKAIPDSPERAEALERLRTICLALPETSEAVSWGSPTFKAGKKAFAVLDHYQGEDCVWFLCGPEDRARLLADPGFFASPYDKKGAAVCRKLSGLDWATMTPLLLASYERAAV